MSTYFQNVFGQPKIDSEGQLLAAQQQAAHDAQFDRLAKAKGFKNGNEMRLFMEQRAQKRPPQTTSESTDVNLADAMAWHPANIFNHITELLKGANNQ